VRPGRRWSFVLLAVVTLAGILLFPLPPVLDTHGESVSLSAVGRTSLAIVASCLVLWVTEAIPFAVTGLLIFLLFPALGVATMAEVLESGLGHPLTLFFLSLSLLSVAFVHVGLNRRVGNWLLVCSKGSARRLFLLTLAVGAALVLGMSALAVASLLVSVALEILEQTQLGSQRGNFGRALLLATSWGPLIGSLCSLTGTGSNLLAVGYLDELAGVQVTFGDWLALGLPAALLLVLIGWLILCRVFPVEQEKLLSSKDLGRLDVQNHSPLTQRERIFLTILGTMLFLWIAGPMIGRLTDGQMAPSMQGVGVAAALVLFLPGLDLLPWSEAEQGVPWGTLLVLAAGLAAGVMLYRSGAARWLAWALLGPMGKVAPVPRVFAMVALVCLLRLMFSSSTAAGAILIPLVIVLAQDLNVDPWLFTAPAAFAINLAFILPTQAAVHMISYSAGYFSSKDMAKSGLLLTLAGVLVVSGVVLLIGRLTGLYQLSK
jgi:sodium-dependent dicarboxylate transporter 2/3/5